MPSWLKGKRNEELWSKAQEIVKKEYDKTEKDDGFWALVTGVYKKSGGTISGKADEDLDNAPAGFIDEVS